MPRTAKTVKEVMSLLPKNKSGIVPVGNFGDKINFGTGRKTEFALKKYIPPKTPKWNDMFGKG